MNLQFQDQIRGSPELQHRRELFAPGLIENSQNPGDLDERRRAGARECSDPTNTTKAPREVSLEYPFWGLGNPSVIRRNVLAIHCHWPTAINFPHILSAISWMLPER